MITYNTLRKTAAKQPEIIQTTGDKLTQRQIKDIQQLDKKLSDTQKQLYTKQNRLIPEYKKQPWTHTKPSDKYALLIDDQDTVGMVAAGYSPSMGQSRIHQVYVKPQYRGHGYAEKLIASILLTLQRDNPDKPISLGVVGNNKAALALYKKLGFSQPVSYQLGYKKPSKDMPKQRRLMQQLADMAQNYKLPLFAVTQGASITRNNGSQAVRNARQNHARWQDAHGWDSKEDWGWK